MAKSLVPDKKELKLLLQKTNKVNNLNKKLLQEFNNQKKQLDIIKAQNSKISKENIDQKKQIGKQKIENRKLSQDNLNQKKQVSILQKEFKVNLAGVKKTYKSQNDSLSNELNLCKNGIKRKDSKILKLNLRIDTQNEKLKELARLKNKLKTPSKLIDALSKQLEEKNKLIDKMEDYVLKSDKKNDDNNKIIGKLNEEIVTLSDKINDYHELIPKLKSNIMDLKNERIGLKNELHRLREENSGLIRQKLILQKKSYKK